MRRCSSLDKENKSDLVFGLDIGTRTVVGVVGYKKDKDFEIIAMEMADHDSRAMVDGQIHDIAEVANVVGLVKMRLEAKIGQELKEVAIAAAGRSLRTYSIRVEHELDARVITKKHVRMLEIDGVTIAEDKLKVELEADDLEYFCVAHTVVNYYLDGYVIANLEGQKGKKIAAEVIATFLPKSVVDSLYAVVNKKGLSVTTLTLEPIAAINVAIPEKLRLLNLCLLDIGAGTSDIAITKDGSITAYGMIPVAGDEITEQIVHNYLVDFQTAEKIKIDCSNEEKITFADILGTIITVKKDEVVSVFESTLSEIVSKVAAKIVELNGGKAPNAIFCVGGGGQVVGLIGKLAKELGLPEERVALRSSNLIENIKYKSEYIDGTNMVTPIGICITAIQQNGYNFIEVKLNGETIRLLNFRRLRVLDAGIVKEFNHENLIGRKGKDLRFILNDKENKIKGEIGVQAEIILNGKMTDLEAFIKEDDNIIIKPAIKGKNAEVLISEFCKQHNINLENKSVHANNQIVDINYSIQDGDNIYIEPHNQENKKNKNIIEKNFTKSNDNVIIILNDKKVELPNTKEQSIFVDLFNYIDVDTTNKKGKLDMKLNGNKVMLTEQIKDGDIAEIKWIEEL
ncbi:MAG: hypothetical protein A2Y24_05255 [Clostridiales bacterium GWE2_32_10]|nr:MAG: hypothetical protein A2Y24_05255 [Clostridiales bacterium GWE2_32_10]